MNADIPSHTGSQAKSTRWVLLVGLATMVLLFGVLIPRGSEAAIAPVNLGTTANFAILAGSTITDVPNSVIVGNVGLSPASGSGIGLTCGEVPGSTIYSVDPAGPMPCRVTNPGLLTIAKNDLTTAYGDAAGRPGGLTIVGNLAGQTLTPGVYKSGSAMDLAVGGTLTLNGQGDPNAVFIFQIVSGLNVHTSATVSLINGAQPCNVFWQVGSSAVVGVDALMVGTIMADQSIALQTRARLDGRALASVSAVTLDQNTIIRSTCAAAAPPPTATSTSVPTATATLPAATAQLLIIQPGALALLQQQQSRAAAANLSGAIASSNNNTRPPVQPAVAGQPSAPITPSEIRPPNTGDAGLLTRR